MAKKNHNPRIKILSGVPISPHTRAPKYPWADLRVGDSFMVDIAKRKSVQIAGMDYGKRHGKKFTTRTIGNQVQIWRTE